MYVAKNIKESTNTMATDYDAPRKTDSEEAAESLEHLKEAAAAQSQTPIEIDENDISAEDIELPGADLSGLSLEVRVVPIQSNEFTCTRCFLVKNNTQLANGDLKKPVCLDCD
jgi:hypothetical protein